LPVSGFALEIFAVRLSLPLEYRNQLGGSVLHALRADNEHFQEQSMASGTVKWFNPTKGYGFIQPQAGGRDVFVHISAVERAGLRTLNEGQRVEYEIESSRGRESAANLRVR
jgi:cold shock protein